MWVLTLDGFYSAVQHDDDPEALVVRTRVKADVDALHHQLLRWSQPSEIVTYQDSDYPWRTITTKVAWAQYLVIAAEEIDYSNFKDAVKHTQGSARASAYGNVWAALYGLEAQDPDRRAHDDRWSRESPGQSAFPWDR